MCLVVWCITGLPMMYNVFGSMNYCTNCTVLIHDVAICSTIYVYMIYNVYVYVYINIHICMHVYIYIYIYTHTYVCTYIYIYTYIYIEREIFWRYWTTLLDLYRTMP